MPPPYPYERPTERCLTCGYVLAGLESPGRCPECGREFDLADSTTYTVRPPFLGWVFWAPGLLLAVLGGTLISALLVFALGNWGYALWVGVPFSAGAVLAYRFRARSWLLPIVLAAAGLGLILGLAGVGLAGAFCGLILAAILAAPLIIGACCGSILRYILKSSGFSQRSYLPVILLFLLPVGAGVLEGRPRRYAPESVTTERVMAASRVECWNSIMFYEEVKHAPPLILRIGLAHPLYTTGVITGPGDRKTCVYNKGVLVKEATVVRAPELLAFDVVEQRIGYERSVRLIGGSFEVEAVAGGTRVRLTTTYEPLLTPRWCWRWGEEVAVHLLHNHVLDGMQMEAEGTGAVSRR